ncbi:hypothetical protein CgunFtcFv8_001725 [Champsocephalus gunnari]|uniref:Uncharacterized protein n=1 Tax=Champsocephalus gunnari TaxID=52237 RepID=A0AAN8CLA0_CHAGU|nr:hypothetical protein CgunFtcFv8_001725 [Champsocephalus gunnari]
MHLVQKNIYIMAKDKTSPSKRKKLNSDVSEVHEEEIMDTKVKKKKKKMEVEEAPVQIVSITADDTKLKKEKKHKKKQKTEQIEEAPVQVVTITAEDKKEKKHKKKEQTEQSEVCVFSICFLLFL